FGTSVSHPERSVIREAGWTRSMREWEYLRVVATIFGLALAGSLGALPVGFVGAIGPSIIARMLAARRRDECARGTVTLLQMTLAGLRSGASLTEALRLAARSGHEPAFAGAVRAFDLGAPLDAALRAARAEARDHRVMLGLDALSLCVAEQLPTSRCAILIASAVDRLAFEQRMVDEVRSRTSGLRVQIVLLAALVPGLALYLAITVPGMAQTLATPLGRFVLLPLAAVFETAGVLVSRRVVSDIT
ncbi:MAG: type II secretion system F family protein, partial [Candidatus Limnocylindria bacterium]